MRIKRFESFGVKKLIWIHGLPGSGKTYLANQINKDGDYSILDDIMDISLIEAEMNKGRDIILSSSISRDLVSERNTKEITT